MYYAFTRTDNYPTNMKDRCNAKIKAYLVKFKKLKKKKKTFTCPAFNCRLEEVGGGWVEIMRIHERPTCIRKMTDVVALLSGQTVANTTPLYFHFILAL